MTDRPQVGQHPIQWTVQGQANPSLTQSPAQITLQDILNRYQQKLEIAERASDV